MSTKAKIRVWFFLKIGFYVMQFIKNGSQKLCDRMVSIWAHNRTIVEKKKKERKKHSAIPRLYGNSTRGNYNDSNDRVDCKHIYGRVSMWSLPLLYLLANCLGSRGFLDPHPKRNRVSWACMSKISRFTCEKEDWVPVFFLACFRSAAVRTWNVSGTQGKVKK